MRSQRNKSKESNDRIWDLIDFYLCFIVVYGCLMKEFESREEARVLI